MTERYFNPDPPKEDWPKGAECYVGCLYYRVIEKWGKKIPVWWNGYDWVKSTKTIEDLEAGLEEKRRYERRMERERIAARRRWAKNGAKARLRNSRAKSAGEYV